jgi:single-stranded-DNA-specific exonuclease
MRWRQRPAHPSAGAELPDAGGLAPLVREILFRRGVTGAARGFLEPSLKDLHDPSLIPDLDKAAARVLAALRAKEQVVIYGDYDVDGVTATAILFHTFAAIAPGADVRTYVPHRLEEGYGLNCDAITELARGGARVIVSVDCGITALEPALTARAAGVDLIITDHHNPPASMADLPDAFAVVHPRRPDSTYPFGELCGAGVAYKLAWRLATLAAGGDRTTPDLRDLLIQLLALTSLGVIADVVPLVGENRVIARHGLSRIKHSPLIGLRALVEASGLGGENVNAEQVGFQLAPRLNASGRMGHARDAVELFTRADEARAAEIAGMLSKQNEERRKTERRIFEQAAELAERSGMTGADRRAIVLAHEEWHPGVVGIVCSRLVEKYGRPTILMQRHDGLCHGSGRSIDGFSLHAGLEGCKHHLVSFGGHDMAAGLKLREDNLDAFIEAFVSHANDRIAPEDLVATLDFDCAASLGALDGTTVAQLDRLAPFGRENPPVRLHLSGLRVVYGPDVFGKENKHLSVRAVDAATARGSPVRLFGWNWAEHRDRFRIGTSFDAIVVPRLNTWNGRTSVECEMLDIRPSS